MTDLPGSQRLSEPVPRQMKVKQNQLITALTNITHETLKEVLNSEIKTLYSIPVQKISPL